MSLASRRDVLSLYRRILQLAKTWKSKDPTALSVEQNYIKNEAKYEFQKNRNLQDEQSIRNCIRDAEARIEIAIHYQNPYPRPVNVPPKALAPKVGKETPSSKERFKKLG